MTGEPGSLPQRPSLGRSLPTQRVFSQPEPTVVHVEGVTHLGGADDDMDVEDVYDTRRDSMDDVVVIGDDELENMIDEQDRAEVIEKLVPAEESEAPQYIWPDVSPNRAVKYQHEVDEVRQKFDAEDEEYDATMCSEYADEIFQYMTDLEVRFHFRQLFRGAYAVSGCHHAYAKLHGRTERDYLGHAPNTR